MIGRRGLGTFGLGVLAATALAFAASPSCGSPAGARSPGRAGGDLLAEAAPDGDGGSRPIGQDQDGGGAPPPPPPPPRPEPPPEERMPASAVVLDEFGLVETVEEPAFHGGGGGMMGGGASKAMRELVVWRGAHNILVDLRRLERVDVLGPTDRDLLLVRLRFAGDDEVPLEGKVERSIELRGKVHHGGYKIVLERVKSIEFKR